MISIKIAHSNSNYMLNSIPTSNGTLMLLNKIIKKKDLCNNMREYTMGNCDKYFFLKYHKIHIGKKNKLL